VLIGAGKNKFKAIAPTASGLHEPIDSRNVAKVKGRDKNYLGITNNNHEPALFTYKN
jgi:hypothetical protein